jgi:hypothetical protein
MVVRRRRNVVRAESATRLQRTGHLYRQADRIECHQLEHDQPADHRLVRAGVPHAGVRRGTDQWGRRNGVAYGADDLQRRLTAGKPQPSLLLVGRQRRDLEERLPRAEADRDLRECAGGSLRGLERLGCHCHRCHERRKHASAARDQPHVHERYARHLWPGRSECLAVRSGEKLLPDGAPMSAS